MFYTRMGGRSILKRFYSVFPTLKDKNRYDVIITGGGMIGTTLACALAKNSLFKDISILLLEAGPVKEFCLQPCYSNRVSAINMKTKRLFEDLGIWEHITSMRYQQVDCIKVWGHCSPNYTKFTRPDKYDIAYIVENDVIIGAVSKVLKLQDNVEILHNSQVKEVHLPEENYLLKKPIVKLQNGTDYACDLLVGADGANSHVRTAMSHQYLSWSYHQSAVVATLNILTDGPNTVAWQRFTPDGPIALLPLTNELSSLVWSTTKSKAKSLIQLADDDFVDELNRSLVSPCRKDPFVDLTGNVLNSILGSYNNEHSIELLPPYVSSVQPGSRAAFPLGFGHSTKYICPRAVLIGDAAHKVHPLAGQGVNLGFSDITFLSKALTDGAKQGRPFGDLLDLLKYQNLSQRHNIPIMLAIDLFHKLYVADTPFVKAIGNACFQIAERVTPIKKRMEWFASGSTQ